MITDANLYFSDAEALTDTAVSEQSVDLGAARKIGAGKQMYVVVIVDVLAADFTSLNIQVVTDTVATLASPTVQIETGTIGFADLTAGRTPIVIPLGSRIGTEEQFLGLQYTFSDAGTITLTSFLIFDYQSNWGD